jgi:hypothetical protein
MLKKWIKALLCVALIVITLPASAAKEVDKSGEMHVQISNMTNDACQLSSFSLIHGVLLSTPPQSIMANDSKSFEARQKFMGPDVLLNYFCKNGSISFRVQQNLVVVIGSVPEVTVVDANNMVLRSESISSSTIWNTQGIINITIH